MNKNINSFFRSFIYFVLFYIILWRTSSIRFQGFALCVTIPFPSVLLVTWCFKNFLLNFAFLFLLSSAKLFRRQFYIAWRCAFDSHFWWRDSENRQFVHPGDIFWAGGGGSPLSKPYRYVPPHRVGGFASFWSENGYTLCPFWSGIGYGFRGNYGSVWTFLSFQFQMSKKEREICEFQRDLNNFCVCALI